MYETESFTTNVLRHPFDSPSASSSSYNSGFGLVKPSARISEKSGSSPLHASEHPISSSPQIPVDSAKSAMKVEPCEDGDQTVCFKNGEEKKSKRKCPGWFGKGYGKNKRPVKKRKLR